MTTNLSQKITSSKPQPDLSRHRITTNQPKPCHFTAQGVQIYSVQDIKAMQLMASRKLSQLGEGVFIHPKEYKVNFVESEVEGLLTRPKTAQNWRGKILTKNQQQVRKDKLQTKGEKVRRKMQGLKKMKRELEKEKQLEEKRQKMQEFKEFVKPRRRSEMDDRELAYGGDKQEEQEEVEGEGEEDGEFKVEEQAGEQCVMEEESEDEGFELDDADNGDGCAPPPMRAKTNRSVEDTQIIEKCQAADDSFEEVEEEQASGFRSMQQVLSKSDVFDNKLNKAIQKMAKQIEGDAKGKKK